MAKPTPKPSAPEVEVPVVRMLHVGRERFDVVAGYVRGVFVETKRHETGVSMSVASGTTKRELEKKHAKELATHNPLMARPS